MRSPSYSGEGMVNLVAELERRLTGTSESPGLQPRLADTVPIGETYVMVLFDGLGDVQLRTHPEGESLSRCRVGALDASFSSQTSVATATMATGVPPARHGLISYLLRVRGNQTPINTLWWFDAEGSPANVDLVRFLPFPNMAERLRAKGAEAVVIEPAAFLGSPLDRVLYRGARTRGVEDDDAMIEAVIEEAAHPGRAVVCYLPYVDAAGHAEGTASEAYADAIRLVTRMWDTIGARLPDHAVMVGTADHGMVDVAPENHHDLDSAPSLVLYGDSRVVYVSGNPSDGAALAAGVPAVWLQGDDLTGLWGPGPSHPEFEWRKPDGLIVADPGVAFTYPGNRVILSAYHGGLTEDELRIPLLVYVSDGS